MRTEIIGLTPCFAERSPASLGGPSCSATDFTRESNKLEAARDEFQAALAIFREVHEPSHINTRTCYRQLGMLEKDAQNWKEGTVPTAHGRCALSLVIADAPARPRRRAESERVALFNFIEVQQRTQEALRLMQQDAAQKNKKAAVPLQLIIDYVEASGSAAGMLQRMGEQKAAHDNFLLAVRHLEPIIGQLPPQQAPPLLMRYADALVGLADTLEHLGKPAESRACAERALGVLKNLVPPQHPLVTTCIQILQRLQVCFSGGIRMDITRH